MALSEFDNALTEVKLSEFIARRRPPEHLRAQVDLSFRIEDQSIVIFEIRPVFRRPAEKIECMVAKATYVKKTGEWKVYWQRADQKWHRYEPAPSVKTLEEFISLVDDDEWACFWG